MRRIRSFEAADGAESSNVDHISDSRFAITLPSEARIELTTSRDEAMESAALTLLGIEPTEASPRF
ncbi:MAG: hypothetical protein HW416_1913 [Chloroflexi bacterium]|nr:hypothetical protein [Chloroflexota bacterium]